MTMLLDELPPVLQCNDQNQRERLVIEALSWSANVGQNHRTWILAAKMDLLLAMVQLMLGPRY